MDPIRIGTRRSELALFQAQQVASHLAAIAVPSELVPYTTLGDRVLDRPLSAIGDKGLFTAELEVDLLAGRIDCAVHSLKDLPTADPTGVTMVAVLQREDPRDALVVAPHLAATTIEALPEGARVGTSSLRRRAQLMAMRPDLELCDLRGNIGTRLRKLDEGVVDAALLAAAGLRRLGLGHRITCLLDAPAWLSAPGQGAIAVQARSDDARVLEILRRLDDAATRLAVSAERALLAALDGGCQVPVGAAVIDEPPYGLLLHGLIASVDGSSAVRGGLPVDRNDPVTTGRLLAQQLYDAGGADILGALRASVPSPTSPSPRRSS